jgi:hypothetical protein
MEELIKQLNIALGEAEGIIDQINEGEINYSQAGEFYHKKAGDKIINALEDVIIYLNKTKSK